MCLISVQEAAFAYDSGIVVAGLNFTVSTGDYLCIVGENGSGKSTLMKGLLGLKQPLKGTIRFGSQLSSSQIGYLPQQTPAQKDFPASVFEVVLSGRLSSRGLRPFYTGRDKGIAAENLELLGVGDLSNKCYRELSGGQQQRVLLARALCASQKLLLLDEPVSGLDPLATFELYRVIKELKERGVTIVMVSHDIQVAVEQATHILHLKSSQLFFGPTAQYLATKLGREYVGGVDNA